MTRYVLRVYRAVSGQWSGRLIDGDDEVCGVAGCASVNEVREAIEATGQRVDEVVNETAHYALHVSRLAGGKVFGRLFDGERDVHGVAAGSVNEARKAMIDAGYRVDFVVDAETGKAL